MTPNQQVTFSESGQTNKPQISWDSIPHDSILEKTPLQLFALLPEQEEQYFSWLEKLPIELVIPDPESNCAIVTGLDLYSVSSCTVAWLLAHCGESMVSALLDELQRFFLDCLNQKPARRNDLYSSQPFVDDQLLFYIFEELPFGCTDMLDLMKDICRDGEFLTSMTEGLFVERNGFSTATMLEVSRYYDQSRAFRNKTKEFFSHALVPQHHASSVDFIASWIGQHTKVKEAYVAIRFSGWNGSALSPGELATELSCSRQSIYNHLKNADEKLSHMSAVKELRRLAGDLFSEIWQRGGICSVDDLAQALAARSSWQDVMSGDGLAKIIERARIRCLDVKHGWAVVTFRSYLPGGAQADERWSYFDKGISPVDAYIQKKDVDGVAKVDCKDEIAGVEPAEIEPEVLHLPELSYENLLLEEWLTNDDFVWQVAGALMSRAGQRGLHQGSTYWSISELCLSDEDAKILFQWAYTGSFSQKKFKTRKNVGGVTFSGLEAITLLYITIASEVARRYATEGEVWPVVYKSFGDGLNDFFMMNLGADNASPRPWLKTEMERTFRNYHLRHAFDSAGTHAYVRSISLQFGFTLNGLQRLPWWLCGQQLPVAVQELLDSGPNHSESFSQFWQLIKEFRWKGIAPDEFLQRLRATPWLPQSSISAMLSAATAKMHLADQDGNSEAAEEHESGAILGPPRLSVPNGAPVFLVPLGDMWPDSLQEPSYVLALDRLCRVNIDRQSDGCYSLPSGDIAVEPLKMTLDVMLYSAGVPVFDEPLRYKLWNEEEEFSFYRANGCKIHEDRVKSDGTPLYVICSKDIVLSSHADTVYALFGNSACLYLFKRGLPAGFTLSLEGESFWTVPDPKKIHGTTSAKPTQALCLPFPCIWGTKARLHINGIPNGISPRRLLVGDMRLQVSARGNNTVESEPFIVPPGTIALPSRATLIGMDKGDLRRFPVDIKSKFAGVVVETPAGWALPDARKVLDKAELQTSRIVALPVDPPDPVEWGFTEGKRFLARPSPYGDRIGQELVGLGAPLSFRRGPYNSLETPVEISRAVIDLGVLTGAERTENGWRIGLRHEQEITDEFAVHVWFPEEPMPVELAPNQWKHDGESKSIVLVLTASYFDAPCSFALSFSGKCIGRTWCGMAAYHDLAKIVWDTPHWQATAAWLAWWHAPVLMQDIRSAVADRVRRQSSDTLVAWLGLSNGEMSPTYMSNISLRMKDAIRTFFHERLPDANKSADVLQSLQLVSGDWDLDEYDAWENYDTLLEISPVLLAHLARTGGAAFYMDKPDCFKELMGLLRRRIAGLGELDSDSDVAEVERNLLATASRVMGVDDQFINRSLLEEARKLLKSETPPVRNLEYCLDIQPLRDWIALRLLA